MTDKQAFISELDEWIDDHACFRVTKAAHNQVKRELLDLIDAYTEQRVIFELEHVSGHGEPVEYWTGSKWIDLEDRIAQLKASTNQSEGK